MWRVQGERGHEYENRTDVRRLSTKKLDVRGLTGSLMLTTC